MDGLLKLLSVGRELLDAGFALQVPQADGGVVTCREPQGCLVRQPRARASERLADPPALPTVTPAPLTARHEIQPVRVHSQACDGVQVSHHGVDQFPTGVVEELDVPVLLRRDGDGKSRVTQDLVDLTGCACGGQTGAVTRHRNLVTRTERRLDSVTNGNSKA